MRKLSSSIAGDHIQRLSFDFFSQFFYMLHAVLGMMTLKLFILRKAFKICDIVDIRFYISPNERYLVQQRQVFILFYLSEKILPKSSVICGSHSDFPLDIPAQIRPESYKTLFFPLICVIIFCFAGIIWFSVVLTAAYITFFALTFFRFRR